MADAKAQGEAQKKADKTKLILEILGIVFAFIPFIDDFTPAIEGLVCLAPCKPHSIFLVRENEG